MTDYLDASILMATLVQEPATPAVKAYLLAAAQDLLVSDFAAAEVASGLSRLIRMQLLDEGAAAARLLDFEAWRAAVSTPVDIHSADARLAYAYAREFHLGLRAPDAMHLAITHRLGARLATLDRRLVRAAKELGVSVAVPSAD